MLRAFFTASGAAILVLMLTVISPVLAETVPLKSQHGTFAVPVVINDEITLNFTLDSGAADVSIPADVFSTLVRTGTIQRSDFLDVQVYELANGTKERSQRFRIRSLKVGGIELRNVTASVAPAAGTLLLGQSFLTRLGTWAIDNRRQVLVINESVSAAPVEAPPAAPVNAPPVAYSQPVVNDKPFLTARQAVQVRWCLDSRSPSPVSMEATCIHSLASSEYDHGALRVLDERAQELRQKMQTNQMSEPDAQKQLWLTFGNLLTGQ
jgi:clan AA aspartic protease (TIGR02281 family)